MTKKIQKNEEVLSRQDAPEQKSREEISAEHSNTFLTVGGITSLANLFMNSQTSFFATQALHDATFSIANQNQRQAAIKLANEDLATQGLPPLTEEQIAKMFTIPSNPINDFFGSIVNTLTNFFAELFGDNNIEAGGMEIGGINSGEEGANLGDGGFTSLSNQSTSNFLNNPHPPSYSSITSTNNQSNNDHNDNPTGPTGPTGNPNNGPPSTDFAPPGVTADEPASTPSQSWSGSSNNNNDQGGDGPGGNSGTAGNNVGSGGRAGPAGQDKKPIVLDLDGDGIELTALADSNAFYDFGEAGDYQHTGWVSADDALLAVDLNDDGIIEGKFELAFAEWGIFAIEENDVTAHDFNNDGVVSLADFDVDDNGIISDLEGLRYFDENKDGTIDQNDSIWDSLRVWQDSDGDGISDDGELSGLTAVDGLEGAGVKSISLTSDQNEQKIEGNIVYGIGTFLTTTGETLELGDVAFAGSGLSYELGDDAISWLEDGETFFESYQLDDDGETFEADATGGHTVAIKGSEGDDTITTSGSSSVILEGGKGDDVLSGGEGNDVLSGDEGADTLDGGKGDDVLIVDSNDTFVGGEGFDHAIFTDDKAQNINISDHQVEGITGGGGDDVFRTDSKKSAVMDGGAGDDELYGSWGTDILETTVLAIVTQSRQKKLTILRQKSQ